MVCPAMAHVTLSGTFPPTQPMGLFDRLGPRACQLACSDHGFSALRSMFDADQACGHQVYEEEPCLTWQYKGKDNDDGPHLCPAIERWTSSFFDFPIADEEWPYIHAVMQHVKSVVDLQYSFEDRWSVIKPPNWTQRITIPLENPPMLTGAKWAGSAVICHGNPCTWLITWAQVHCKHL